MALRYFLTFMGTGLSNHAIDPARFPVVLRVERVDPSDDEEVLF